MILVYIHHSITFMLDEVMLIQSGSKLVVGSSASETEHLVGLFKAYQECRQVIFGWDTDKIKGIARGSHVELRENIIAIHREQSIHPSANKPYGLYELDSANDRQFSRLTA